MIVIKPSSNRIASVDLSSCPQVTYLPVKATGRIDLEELEKAMTKETSLVSIMMVNNEIGVVQPVKEIGELCRSKKASEHHS